MVAKKETSLSSPLFAQSGTRAGVGLRSGAGPWAAVGLGGVPGKSGEAFLLYFFRSFFCFTPCFVFWFYNFMLNSYLNSIMLSDIYTYF
jgi:hypothetical protein